jgi:hypothetical protein
MIIQSWHLIVFPLHNPVFKLEKLMLLLRRPQKFPRGRMTHPCFWCPLIETVMGYRLVLGWRKSDHGKGVLSLNRCFWLSLVDDGWGSPRVHINRYNLDCGIPIFVESLCNDRQFDYLSRAVHSIVVGMQILGNRGKIIFSYMVTGGHHECTWTAITRKLEFRFSSNHLPAIDNLIIYLLQFIVS